MSNIFESALNDLGKLEEELLGPDYKYYSQVKTPSEMKMASTGSFKTIENNLSGLISYVNLLVSGDSKASKTGGALGNKFFMKTGAKCKDKDSGKMVDRYVYINNVPDGSIPFVSSMSGVNMSEFKGLIPGTMGNINNMNPLAMLQSFMIGSEPECQPLTMETITVDNDKSMETQNVITLDIKNMNPCWFPKKRGNPISKVPCRETFDNMKANTTLNYSKLPDGNLEKLYIVLLSILMMYILIRLMQKKK